MSLTTLSATTVLLEPMTVTAQQLPFAVMIFEVPLTIRVESLQSSTCSRPIPVIWVSPFLAYAAGGGAAGVAAIVMAQVASAPATGVQFTAGPPSLGRVDCRLSIRKSLERGYVDLP